jgi:hypothetical protein
MRPAMLWISAGAAAWETPDEPVRAIVGGARQDPKEANMAATVREAIRELMTQTMATMDALLEAPDPDWRWPRPTLARRGKICGP